ncbi:PEP-CTERM/exosortase system-associated acyltransferase [Crocosphaera sp. Alani8]|uniref:PEP-CTERM/exosortase system-associated acyltransferase n=1 Tax=Crocosphaera sp. Alani8 TaxID=3038952 RepID=UPI00313AB045
MQTSQKNISNRQNKRMGNQLIVKKYRKYEGVTEHFFNHFTPIFAHTDKLKQEIYKIRYQVYCEELNYESKNKFLDKKEQDVYDHRSYHFLLEHKPSGQYVGCVRLIFPTSEKTQVLFPFEKIYNKSVNFDIKCRQNHCEISRLAILKTFRKPQKNSLCATGVNFCTQDKKYNVPLISMGLHGAYISMAAFWGFKLFCLIEKSLARHYQLYGIKTHQIGPMIDYRGKRIPFLMKPREILRNIDPSLRELFEAIQQKLLSSTPSLSLLSV